MEFLLPLLCLSLSTGTLCAKGKLANQLLRDLFANDSRNLRPVLNTDQTLNVTLQITLFQIIDMDERNQILTTYLWIRQVWNDAFRHWDKDEYGGIDILHIPSSYLWKPDVILYNNAEDHFASSTETNVVVRHNGQVTWDSPVIARTSCKLDISSFPFDGQRCPLTFGSWTYSGSDIDLVHGLERAGLSDFEENVEWEVLGMLTERNVVLYRCCSESYPDITVTLTLQRRPSFYIYNLLLPCVMISSLVPLSFYLPADSDEKVSLGVTILLAFTVFQQMVAEIVPPSETVPLIGKYYIATMLMMTASTALSMLILNIHHCGPEVRPVPHWAKVVFLRHMASILLANEVGRKDAGGTEAADEVPKPTNGHGLREAEIEEEELGQFLSNTSSNCSNARKELRLPLRGAKVDRGQWGCGLRRWERLVRNLEFITDFLRHQRETQRQVSEWRRVARVIDRLYMCLYILMVCSMSVFIMVKAL